MTSLTLDVFLKQAEGGGQDLQVCPRCGYRVPRRIALCWRCGELLDRQLIRLVRSRDA